MRGNKKEKTLTSELSAFLAKVLVPDLAERARQPSVKAVLERRHAHERARSRTAESYEEWRDAFLEQVGAAWVLSCVFIRTLEDRELVSRRRLAGPGASDSEEVFFKLAPALTQRDYLLTVFRELSRLPSAKDLLGPEHNAAWKLSPSPEAVGKLLELLRTTSADGKLVWRFDGADTRFLGDLYQDLSEAVQKRYALLQTPRFVERFILDQTLEPAIKEFGLEGLRIIDPTCGSGHFLLGAFERLLDHHQRTSPGIHVKELAIRALSQVYGVDLNPYAVAIARFRLTLAFLEKTGLKLKSAPPLPRNVIVADSLLHGGIQQQKLSEQDTDRTTWGDELFALEDESEARRIFDQHYHAVVGNPPYITCKDAALREEYRKRYESCYREFALAAPFTERFFQLAEPGGFVGLINSNSFMKREFGRPLIERVLSRIDLHQVIDTSGAIIPGHGTPTVLLFGRNCRPSSELVRGVLSKRGEPSTPSDPAKGRVWDTIVSHYCAESGFEDEFISVAEIPRTVLSKWPWTLGGGGANALRQLIEERASRRLADVVVSIGRTTVCGDDDVWIFENTEAAERAAGCSACVPLVVGECVRDWALHTVPVVLYPYTRLGGPPVPDDHPLLEYLWRFRSLLAHRTIFGKTVAERGNWYEHLENYRERLLAPLSITFAEIATHSHFVLDRGGKVFNRTAPVIKLPENAREEEHYALLGYLNSSTAAFFFRQTGHNKGAQGVNEGVKSEAWEQFIVRSGTVVAALPVPVLTTIGPLARLADELATDLGTLRPEARSRSGASATESRQDWEQRGWSLFGKLVAIQEEIDWAVYDCCGLLEPVECEAHRTLRNRIWGAAKPLEKESVPALAAGARPFEAVMLDVGEGGTWFTRNGYDEFSRRISAPTGSFAELLRFRRDIIAANPKIRLLERPEYKRRWMVPDIASEVGNAFRDSVLESAEQNLAKASRPLTASELMTQLRSELVRSGYADDPAFLNLALTAEAVPFTSASFLSVAGVAKMEIWQRVWAEQRKEDAGGSPPSEVPPRFDSKDFQRSEYWALRGKLNVPHERFISYPNCSPDGQSTLYGWAGWNEAQRALVLGRMYQERKTQDGWSAAQLTPLLVGMLELVPWLKQWHNEPNEEFGGERLGDYFANFVETEARAFGISLDDLRNWRPVKEKRGKKASTPATVSPEDAEPKPKKPRKKRGASEKSSGEV